MYYSHLSYILFIFIFYLILINRTFYVIHINCSHRSSQSLVFEGQPIPAGCPKVDWNFNVQIHYLPNQLDTLRYSDADDCCVGAHGH